MPTQEAVSTSSIRIIRPADVDIPELLTLIRGLAVYEGLEHTLTVTEDDLRYALFGPQPTAEAMIVMCEEQHAGYALFYTTFSAMLGRRSLFLDNIYVRPEFRGFGVGNALFRQLASIAAERNCARIEWVCLDWNTSALGFYQAEGTELHKEWIRCRLTQDEISHLASSNGR